MAGWVREVAWSLFAGAALLLWHGQVEAACDSGVVVSLILEDRSDLPEQSEPCCTRAGAPLAAGKPHPGAAPATPASSGCPPFSAGASPTRLPVITLAAFRHRSYCERSSRLLR